MRTSVGLAASASALLFGGAAWSQTPDTTPAPTAPPAAASDALSDGDVANFARATLQLHKLSNPTPERMAEVITGAGLSVEVYNAIAGRMQTDAAFQTRVNAELVKAQAQAQAQTQARAASGA